MPEEVKKGPRKRKGRSQKRSASVCVTDRDGNVTRIKRDKAAELVAAGKRDYCPKSRWKAQNQKEADASQ